MLRSETKILVLAFGLAILRPNIVACYGTVSFKLETCTVWLEARPMKGTNMLTYKELFGAEGGT